MNCQDCETLILDETGTHSEAAAISAHLSACEKCRKFLGAQQALRHLLCNDLRTIRLSGEFESGLRDRIRRDQSLRSGASGDRVHGKRIGSFTEWWRCFLVSGSTDAASLAGSAFVCARHHSEHRPDDSEGCRVGR